MNWILYFLNIILALLSVIIQKYCPFSQWIIIYGSVFVISWYGGMIHGILATVVSISFAGFYLIPSNEFDIFSFIQLVTLILLGIWTSYSMFQYKNSLSKLTASEELIKSFGVLDTLLENIPLMVFVKDAKDLKFVRYNKSGLDLIGLKKEDVLGKSDFDIFPHEQAKFFTDFDRRVLSGKGIVDIPSEEISTKFNGKRILHTKKIPITDKNGKAIYLLGVAEDITDRLEAEELRIREAARLERQRIQENEILIANTISTLSTTLDYEETLKRIAGVLVPDLADWSALILKTEAGKFERVASVHRDPEKQIFLDELVNNFPPGDDDKEIIKALYYGRSSLRLGITEEGIKQRPYDQGKIALYSKLGMKSSIVLPVKFRDKIIGALTLTRGPDRPEFDEIDLTFAEEIGLRTGAVLENSMLFKQTQKAVRARDEFLSIASHELKTPITSLKLQLQILLRGQKNSHIEKPLNNAITQVDRLTLLVNDLLDVSRFESGRMTFQFQKFDLVEVIQHVCNSFRDQYLVGSEQFRVTVPTELIISGDAHRLEQVIINLLNNAFKYGDQKPIEIRLEQGNRNAIITVKDQGKGIPPEHVLKIFNKFERGTQDATISGLGLGLFITKEIILAHRGQINVQSRLGQGSEFIVTLPIA